MVYVIVVGTLVLPSLGLEQLIRRLGLAQPDALRQEEIAARRHVAQAGLARLDHIAAEDDIPGSTVDRLRGILELRLARLKASAGRRANDANDAEAGHAAIGALRRELIAAERGALTELRAQRALPAQVLARIERDIDLDEEHVGG